MSEKVFLKLPCGAQYEGPVDDDGQPYHQGKVTTPMRLDGAEMYVGELYNGRPWGKGTIIYPNGFCFTGTFELNTTICGIVTDSQKVPLSGYHANVPYLGYRPFYGYFVNGMREGPGLETNIDGRTLEGNYSADKWNGTFLYTDQTGKQYEQVWADSIFKSHKEAGPAELQAALDRSYVAIINRTAAHRIIDVKNMLADVKEVSKSNETQSLTELQEEMSRLKAKMVSQQVIVVEVPQPAKEKLLFKCRCKAMFETNDDLVDHVLECNVVKKAKQSLEQRSESYVKCACGLEFASTTNLAEHQGMCQCVQQPQQFPPLNAQQQTNYQPPYQQQQPFAQQLYKLPQQYPQIPFADPSQQYQKQFNLLYECPLCPIRLETAIDMRNHIQIHHDQK